MKPSTRIYCDEAGLHAGSPCYGIGMFAVPEVSRPALEDEIRRILDRYKVTEELKWSRIADYTATRRAAFESINVLLKAGVRYNAIVVEKESYRLWRASEEKA